MTKEERALRDLAFNYIVVYSPAVRTEWSKAITALIRAVRLQERERCAKVAEETPYKLCDGCAKHLAAAIRSAKGEK